jgi:hypothetical protein
VKSTWARVDAEHDPAQNSRPKTVAPGAGQPARTIADAALSVSAASPARVMQDQLSARLSEGVAETRWSRRASLTFIVGTCSAFWAAAFWAVSATVGR